MAKGTATANLVAYVRYVVSATSLILEQLREQFAKSNVYEEIM